MQAQAANEEEVRAQLNKLDSQQNDTLIIEVKLLTNSKIVKHLAVTEKIIDTSTIKYAHPSAKRLHLILADKRDENANRF